MMPSSDAPYIPEETTDTFTKKQTLNEDSSNSSRYSQTNSSVGSSCYSSDSYSMDDDDDDDDNDDDESEESSFDSVSSEESAGVNRQEESSSNGIASNFVENNLTGIRHASPAPLGSGHGNTHRHITPIGKVKPNNEIVGPHCRDENGRLRHRSVVRTVRENHVRSVAQSFQPRHQQKRIPKPIKKFKIANYILGVSFLLWAILQARFYYVYSSKKNPNRKTFHPPPQMRTAAELLRLRKEAEMALGTAANDPKKKVTAIKKKSKTEDLPDGCALREWQNASFPNCQELHSIDLVHSLGMTKTYGLKIPHHSATGNNGYVGSGLWRDVWKLQSGGTAATSQLFVLKMMKMEHDVNTRNFDRHRRDAITMERLTANPHVVSAYGHCGNSVLSEFIGDRLDQLIYNDETERKKKWYLERPPVRVHNENATRNTPTGRLRLALDVARGIAALHTIEPPIIHADIQAKQFLVDSSTGRVHLNDFNRCRFVPVNKTSGNMCKVKIPSAPGSLRSPEEYSKSELWEQLDIFSIGHILYGILTGKEPFGEEKRKGKVVKNLVLEGTTPKIGKEFRKEGTTDAALAGLTDKAYILDPNERITAKELVVALEQLLQDDVL